MSNESKHMIYGLKNGNLVSIDEVDKGLQCDCICPACGEKLIAKKGEKRVHHFAHISGNSCEYGYETSLHMAAKDIISKAQLFVIPEVYVEFPDSYKSKELIANAKVIDIDNVMIEHKIDSIKPDIIIESAGKLLMIEIYVTHKVDEIKLNKIKSLGISTIEIDLSKCEGNITPKILEEKIVYGISEKQWIYNTIADACLQNFIYCSEILPVRKRGLAIHVDNCPIKSRVWKGKSYANFIDNCLYCEYCISRSHPDGIICSGREAISKYKDFKIPKEERIKNRNDFYNEKREVAFYGGTCPYCRGSIRKINGPYGLFWSCSNYKNCAFKVNPKHNTDIPDLSVLYI